MMDLANYHKFNEIIVYLKIALENMLNDVNGELAKQWQVVRANQPTIQALQNNTVYFDIISKRRYGVQGTKPVPFRRYSTTVWQEESVWFEEILVQVSAFKQREPDTDTQTTDTSSDIIALLQGALNASTTLGITWTNSDKRNYFLPDWMNVIRSTDIREVEFETDSGLKDKFPQFDFLVVVEQRLLKNIAKIDTIDIATKRI